MQTRSEFPLSSAGTTSRAAARLLPTASALEALGPAGATRVFVHSLSSELLKTIAHMGPGYPGYVARALLLAAPGDVVCVSEPVEAEYLRFLNELGIGPRPDGVVLLSAKAAMERPSGVSPVSLAAALRGSGAALDEVAARLPADRQVALSTFAGHFEDAELCRALSERAGRRVSLLAGPSTLVDSLNRKERGRALAAEAGVPVARGEVVERVGGRRGRPPEALQLLRSVERLLGVGSRVLVRGSTGASGSATWIVEGGSPGVRHQVERIAAQARDSVLLVDEMLDVTASPNVLLHVDDEGAVRCVGVTDQWLDGGLRHLGNLSPSRCAVLVEVLLSAGAIGERLARQGYLGFAGIDLVEHLDPRTGAPRHAFAELNARVNAALYPLALSERLRAEAALRRRSAPTAFAQGGVITTARSFLALAERCGRLFFDPASGRGVVPYPLVDPLPGGKLGVVALGGSREEALELYETFRRQVEDESAPSMPPAA